MVREEDKRLELAGLAWVHGQGLVVLEGWDGIAIDRDAGLACRGNG